MISILNAIRSIFVGNKEVQSISVGNTVVYEAQNSYSISSPHVVYSEGSALYASGQNEARLIGTLVTTYLGNVINTSEIVIDPSSISGSGFYITGTRIKANNRGTTTGSQRTAQVTGTYDFGNGQPIFQETFTITQEENLSGLYKDSYVTIFELNGHEDGDTIELTAASQTLTVSSAELVRRYEYSSGSADPSHTLEYILNQTSGFWDACELVNVDNASWINIGTSSASGTVTIDAYTGNSDRSARISFRDKLFDGETTSNAPVITIRQVVASYVLEVSNQTIPATYYDFQIPITSKNQGTVYTDLTVTISNSTFVNLQYYPEDLEYNNNGTVRLPFACAYNSTSTARTATITVRQNGAGGLTRTFTLTQSALSSNFDGITIKGVYGNWVLGEITGFATGYKGFLVAKDSPLSTDRAYNFNIGSFEYSYNYNNSYINEISDVEWKIAVDSVTQKATIFIKNQGTWTSVATNRDPYISNGPNTYYGCWVWYNSTEFTAAAGTNNNHIEYVEDFEVYETSG